MRSGLQASRLRDLWCGTVFDMKLRVLLHVLVPGLLVLGQSLWSQTSRSAPQHWTETESETLWRVQYSNEDYGYQVRLAAGTIGHGTHSPNPNHGFLVPLPDVGRELPASTDEARFVWVDASYNATDFSSLSQIAAEQVHIMDDQRASSHVVGRKLTKLAGITAIVFTSEYSSPKGDVVEEQLIALRSGIIYTIWLRTTKANRLTDEEQFRRIQSGFRLLALHNRAVK